jgi:hypothetical protein
MSAASANVQPFSRGLAIAILLLLGVVFASTILLRVSRLTTARVWSRRCWCARGSRR